MRRAPRDQHRRAPATEKTPYSHAFSLIHPAAVASKIGRRRALPRAVFFLDRENSPAPAKAAAALDHRYQRPCVRLVKSRNTQVAHMPDPLVPFACRGIPSMRRQASQYLPRFVMREQPVALRDREFLLPVVALAIGRHKGVRHLMLFRRRWLQAAAIELRDIGHGVLREHQRLLRRSLIKRRVDFVSLRRSCSSARLV